MRIARQPFARRVNGEDVFPGLGVAAFAEETVVPTACVIPVPDDIPLATAALLGCAALTGFGAVRNCARVRPGQSVLVLGAGGVGLMALQAARLHKAQPIIAVDVNEKKEAQARACGATEFLVAGPCTMDAVRDLTGGTGVDHAIECVGSADTIERAWAATRRGGVTTVVGAGGRDERASFTVLDLFHSGRSIVGCLHGNAHLSRELPELLRHVRSGDLDLAAVVTDWIKLEEIPDAFGRLTACHGGRSVVLYAA
jgi:S-(hydroxymethyl)glutathione dehydrogenase/alcohol dehydrogenase